MHEATVWGERARLAAWSALVNIDELGLDDDGRVQVVELARSLTELPDQRKARLLREALSRSTGLTVSTVVSWLDEVPTT
ncbi:hypothetical protein [Actinomycetospora chiangmaiensis]|uniref:hypothetical protein n=1 Tax=Actinomycetospora chiangmaiensis TaxID=402650 RepID=UPI00036384D8|nr:hypothetical protein [Actinomycetospora chiangmaiensis]